MHKKEKFIENQFSWPICKKLLFLILEDKVSDVFVCELVWERLFYTKELSINDWTISALTPSYWSEKFKKAYLISGSPKCPLTGLTGGELGLGINPLSSEKQSFSIAQ